MFRWEVLVVASVSENKCIKCLLKNTISQGSSGENSLQDGFSDFLFNQDVVALLDFW